MGWIKLKGDGGLARFPLLPVDDLEVRVLRMPVDRIKELGPVFRSVGDGDVRLPGGADALGREVQDSRRYGLGATNRKDEGTASVEERVETHLDIVVLSLKLVELVRERERDDSDCGGPVNLAWKKQGRR